MMDGMRKITTFSPHYHRSTAYFVPIEVIPYDTPEDMTKPWIRDSHFIPIVLVYSLCMIVGSAGNALFMWAMQCDRKGRSATGMFLVSLAVADLLLLSSIPPDVAQYFMRSIKGGDISCKMVVYTRQLSAFSTVLNLMAITIERFIVIVYPMRARQFCTMRNCKATLVCVWTLAILMAIPAVFTWEVQPFYYGKFDNNSNPIDSTVVNVLFCEDEDESRQIMSFYSLVFLFILPLAIQIFCYGKMISVLWSSTRDVYLTSHGGGLAGRFKMSYTPDPLTKSSLMLNDVTHVPHNHEHRLSVMSGMPEKQRRNSSALDRHIASRHLSSDVTGYQFGRNRSESLAFTECPLGCTKQHHSAILRFLNFPKRSSEARCKSRTSLLNNNGVQVDNSQMKQHHLDLKAGRRQVIKMLVAVNVAFIICWGPHVIFDVVRCLRGQMHFGNVLYMTKLICKLLPYTHCCLNPIIYGFMSKNFRKALRKACTAPVSCAPPTHDTSCSADELRIKSAQIFLNDPPSASLLTPKPSRRRLSSVNF